MIKIKKRCFHAMLSVGSFFSGVGGIDLAFIMTGDCDVVYANEIDEYPAETYKLNFDNLVDIRDVCDIRAKTVPDMDILVAGFPCQPFSIAGKQEGFADSKGRGLLFFELIRIMKEKRPRVALFENVRVLLEHDRGNTFRTICEALSDIGYTVTYQVMNAMYYGNVPQCRERIYIVALRDKPDMLKFSWPLPIELTTGVRDIIDFDKKVDSKYYYTDGKFAGDIYDKLCEAMVDDNIHDPYVYQWRRKYVRRNQSHVIPTLTANMGMGGHNVCLVKTKYGIRKLTPRECFRAQGFPDDFRLPEQSNSRLYKQAGNSVCVPVVHRIAERIAEIF